MIGRKAEAVLNRAVRYAVEQEHEYFTLEHVMWSLLAESDISELIRACGGNPRELKQALEAYMQVEVPKAQGRPDAQPRPGKVDNDEGEESSESPVDHPVATVGIQRLVQRALFHVQSAGKDEIQPSDLLVAFFQSKESYSLHLLAKQGIERLDVLNFLSHGLRKDGGSAENGDFSGGFGDEVRKQMREGESPDGGANGAGGGAAGESKIDPLKAFTLNLNERARMGRIDPLIGRESELERMIQTLCRRRKNNPLLVGEAGVGKTALAEGLALRIVNEEVPDLLHNAVIYALDLGSLIAGTKFRGDFEQRLKRVLSSLQKKKEQGLLPILLIDEIHTIVGAGAVSGGALDAANLLKPALAQGDLRCIGSTTYPEYRNVFEKDHALARRFQKIDIAEPGIEDAVQILTGLKPRFEEHHGVHYTPEAIRAAVELSVKHLSERYLPDKAIDVVDEAGARARILKSKLQAAAEQQPARAHDQREQREQKDQPAQASPGSQGSQGSDVPTTITAELIEEMVAQIARIPARTVSVSQKDRLRNLERDLRLSVFGQDAAVDALVTAIRLARSGLRSGERPVGSFLFCGPTGVGKTELSKQLAHCLGVPFLRFDMSEYSEKHTVSRLIGAPPGYVGFDQAGLLTDAILKNPHSVVLLDEIEKAHPEIWNILLQVMDHGTLTDNNGRRADFRNAVIIMTSNVGSRDMERRPLGMGDVSALGNAGAQKALEQTFSPEFRNRLDAIVFFNPLSPAVVAQVVGKVLVELESQLLSKGVEAEFTIEAREWLARKGYDRQMGARPLSRLIQDKIKKALAEEILFGRLENGGEVKIGLDVARDELTFDIRARAPDSREERVVETVPH